MAVTVEIFNDSGIKGLALGKVKEAALTACKGEKIRKGSINIIYLDNKKIHRLNKTYLNHNFPTDVITFSLGEDENTVIGEIYIGTEIAIRQAKEFNVSLTNELKRLAVHGILHLAGHDDSSPDQREAMNALETKYING